MNAQELLQEISDYCRRTGLAESTFGRRAVNDGKLASRLRNGGRITTDTLDRIRAFISSNNATILLDGVGSTELLHIFITNRTGDAATGDLADELHLVVAPGHPWQERDLRLQQIALRDFVNFGGDRPQLRPDAGKAAQRGHELYSFHQGDLAWTRTGVTGYASQLHLI